MIHKYSYKILIGVGPAISFVATINHLSNGRYFAACLSFCILVSIVAAYRAIYYANFIITSSPIIMLVKKVPMCSDPNCSIHDGMLPIKYLRVTKRFTRYFFPTADFDFKVQYLEVHDGVEIPGSIPVGFSKRRYFGMPLESDLSQYYVMYGDKLYFGVCKSGLALLDKMVNE